jgi:N-dimethylarginine dimethylaminohydrolase
MSDFDLSTTTVPMELTSSRPVLLMCEPRLYAVDYVINPWMSGNIGASSQPRAMQQWHRLYEVLKKVAQVELVDPVAGSPDMVFTANAGLALGNMLALSSFFHPERQGEEAHFRQWFMDAGYQVVELSRGVPFEGEGDALFSIDGKRLWAGFGTRSAETSHAVLADALKVEVVGLRLIDPRFYHLDTCFAPLSDGSVLYYPEAFDASSRARIESFYPEEKRIAVREEDAVRFACNAINLGSTIVLNEISAELADRLRQRGFEVVQVLLDEFLKAGGAAKCLVMKLSAERHTGSQHNALTPVADEACVA